MRIAAQDGRFRAVVMVDAAYMLPEFRGDADVAAKDLAWLRGLDRGEWQRIQDETTRFLSESLVFRSGDAVLNWESYFPDFGSDPPSFMNRGIPESLPMIEVILEGPLAAGELRVAWEEAFGVNLIVQMDEQIIPIVSGYQEPVLRVDKEEESLPVEPTLMGWIRLGFRHIVPDGLDHILFILGIFLLQPKWKPLLAQSLVFTLAHSVTLGVAVLGLVRFPGHLVEIAIGASIAWIGVENLRARDPGKGRYLLIGIFGLIHGLGFASMLKPYLSDDPGALIFGLFGFNLGVELGQILVLAISFALLGWLPEAKFAKARMIGSAIVAMAGIAMVIGRIAG